MSVQEHKVSVQEHTVSVQEHTVSVQEHKVSVHEHKVSVQEHTVSVQEYKVSVHITTVRMNTGTTLSMETNVCAGIVPELRWTAAAPSGTSMDPKHKGSMTGSQLRQPKSGT